MSNEIFDQGFDFQAPPKGAYLGDHDTVAQLVNQFAHDVLGVYHDFSTGKGGAENAQPKIEAMAKRLGDIFMGRMPEEFAPADWNKPSRLGVKLRHSVDSITGDEDPGEAYFKWLALQVIQCGRAMDLGMAPEQAGPMLRTILDDTIGRLLGVV